MYDRVNILLLWCPFDSFPRPWVEIEGNKLRVPTACLVLSRVLVNGEIYLTRFLRDLDELTQA